MTIQQLLSRTGLLLAPDAPSGEGAPAGTPTGGEGVKTDIFSLPKAEYDALVAARIERDALKPKVSALEENWGAAQRLIKGEGDQATLEASTRHVLKAAGWSEGQIASHLESLREEEAPKGPSPRSDGRGTRPKGASPSGDSEEPSELEVLRQDVTLARQEISKQEVHRLGVLFKQAVTGSLDGTPELVTVMEDLVKVSAPSDEGKAKAYKDNLREQVTSEVDREFRDRLRLRRSQNGNRWDDGWVAEEAAKAAKAVATKYRTFVPDPSRIGKVSETGVGDDYITSTTPVSKPSFRKGDTVADVQEKAKAWSADYLIRGGEPAKV